MYSTCLYCHESLGSNRVLEELPIGQRLAFDPEKGRLWVVCGACRGWNLSPLDTRWEAVEACERLFRETPTRVSTDQIALASTRGGLDLVRIGRPVLPEFAAWRYGDRLRGRRWSGIARAIERQIEEMLLGQFRPPEYYEREAMLPLGSARSREGELFVLRAFQVSGARLDPDDSEQGWCLRLPTERGGTLDRFELVGREAVKALRLAMPAANKFGGSGSAVADAVGLIEEAGGVESFFGAATESARSRGFRYSVLGSLPARLRLGLEIAANEDRERQAWEGELWVLEQEWREAEELAEISDSLLTPEAAEEFIERVRARTTDDPDAGV